MDKVKAHEASYYDTHANRRKDVFNNPKLYVAEYAVDQQRAYFFNKLLRDFPVSETGLEVGSGEGRWTPRFLERTKNVIGIDISPKILEVAKEFLKSERYKNITFQLGDAENLDFENNSFDAVTLIRVIALLPHPVKAIEESNRVLKINGHLVLNAYNGDYMSAKRYYNDLSSNHSKVTIYREKEIVELLNKKGFDVLKIRYTWSYLDWLVSIFCGRIRKKSGLRFLLLLARVYYKITYPFNIFLGRFKFFSFFFREFVILAKKTS